MDKTVSNPTNDNNTLNVQFKIDEEEPLPKKTFFHQWMHFQISKNPHLVNFAKAILLATYPRSLYKVEFNDDDDLIITYDENEDPIKFSARLTKEMYISDVSWSLKYNCYFDYLNGCPFVINADIIILLYLAALEESIPDYILGSWMRSATKGRYVGFNPVHLQ